MAKRGRKTQLGVYFGPLEEEAVVRYLKSEDQRERNDIYNNILKNPLDKMIESIIRRYQLYRKAISFNELHADTLSHLITKAHKFEGSRGKKAYSYYGTICKNYLLALLIKDEKQLKQITSYGDIYEIGEAREDLSYEIDKETVEVNKLISDIINEINRELAIPQTKSKNTLNENERKIGVELISILENFESFVKIKGGSKYNRNIVLSCLRESTHLSTKDIRNSMKKFKKLYAFVIDKNITG